MKEIDNTLEGKSGIPKPNTESQNLEHELNDRFRLAIQTFSEERSRIEEKYHADILDLNRRQGSLLSSIALEFINLQNSQSSCQ